MNFSVIEGPPDEMVQLKYIEEARPRETGKRRERITAPQYLQFCMQDLTFCCLGNIIIERFSSGKGGCEEYEQNGAGLRRQQ